MNRNDLINSIAEDLQIKKIDSKEANDHFFARVVYSALSMHLRASTLDTDILLLNGIQNNKETVGRSSSYICKKCNSYVLNLQEPPVSVE